MNNFNPARVDFITLRLFTLVAQYGSISKAAIACNLATSAASRRLSDLEESVQTRLLERSSHGVTITPMGSVVLAHAIRIVRNFEDFGAEIRDYSSGTRGRVTLWANLTSLLQFIPEVLGNFLPSHPGIRVNLEEKLSRNVVEGLHNEEADIGIFASGESLDGLKSSKFQSDKLVLVCLTDHPLAGRDKVAFEECLSYSFVGLSAGSSLLGLASRAAAKAGVSLRTNIQVHSFDVIREMIISKLGIGIMPARIFAKYTSIVQLTGIPLTDEWAKRDLIVARKSSKPLSPAADVLLNSILSSSMIKD